jgi:hypothetical protein
MSDVPLAGALSGLSLPRLLFSLSAAGRSGRLSIPGSEGPVSVFIDRGRLLLDAASVPGGAEAFQASLDAGGTNPQAAWNALESAYKARLIALFDAPLASYEFEPGLSPPDEDVLSVLPLRPVLVAGLRNMTNDGLIGACLPDAGETLQAVGANDDDRLDPPERYLLRALGAGRSLADLRRLSRLGPRQTDRTIHLLLCLGLAGRSAAGPPAPPGRELSPSEVDRMMASFRDKSNAIFKYISKELGPFARTVLGKALEEVKPSLGALFESVELLEDGAIEFKSPLKININLLTEDSLAELARGLTEILSAEVLAVKKSLGNDHEAALVRNLEKVGEWS